MVTAKIEMEDYDNHSETHKEEKVAGTEIDLVEISYDRGRLHLSINGRDVLEDKSGMSDFSLTIRKKD